MKAGLAPLLLFCACGPATVPSAPVVGDDTPVPATPMATADVAPPTVEVRSIDDVTWEQLNPARGDASPRATDLWGDRKAAGKTGFLVRFVDGFSSPPHIHNVAYRGLVISGLVHNDAPEAEEQWMPPGSFWTQPEGGAHITSARGGETTAYIEIDDGPYLVRPPDQAFAADAAPRNVPATDISWSSPETTPHRTAHLWGESSGAHGRLHELQPSASMTMQGPTSSGFRAVVIAGRVDLGRASVAPGSYFRSKDRVGITCHAEGAPCLVYVRAEGPVKVDDS